MSLSKRKMGQFWEQKALDYLQKMGYRFLAKNYRSDFGEIDIICEHQQTLIFVEVKKRSSYQYGAPEEAVDRIKQKRLVQTALMYIQENDLQNMSMRFDVLAFGPDTLSHFKNAFSAGHEYYF